MSMQSSKLRDDSQTFIDDTSINSEKVHAFEGHNADVQPVIRQRSNSKIEDRESLSKLISNNKGVERIVSELEEGAGKLGGLEEPLDLKRIETHQDPNSSFNEKDPWKYPIDQGNGSKTS